MSDYFGNKHNSSQSNIAGQTKKSSKRKKRRSFHGKFDKDVIGVSFLQICRANDLPPERNLSRTSFDMDPFVVVSYGTTTFRTTVIRHNLNPVWNEKLFFHIRHTETTFHLKFTIYDREKFSGNGRVAWCELPIQDIINKSSRDISLAEAVSDDDNTIEKDMDLLTFPLQLDQPMKWKDKHPTLTIRAKFMPYQQIRKLFWASLAKTYDIEQSGTLNLLQVQTMLDTIGSTISEATLKTFWRKHGKDPNEDEELTLNQLVECLEEYIKGEDNENEDNSTLYSEIGGIRINASEENKTIDTGATVNDDDDIKCWNNTVIEGCENKDENDEDDDDDETTEISDSLLFTDDEEDDMPPGLDPELFNYSLNLQTEKVIRLKECPICHKPNLSRKSQMDILTHVATCAANDWTTVDRFLMQNFLTEAYAQRRWLGKLVRKVSYGRYSLGRDNANILVQDRTTGHLIEEKIAAHVRLGMRLVYKRMKHGIQSKAAQRLLTNMTLKQGRRFDSPRSAKEIPAFIKFHNISLDDVARPLSSFKTFNQFFYRKLKPGSRPIDSPDDAAIAVSPADCRMTVFDSITEATTLWIKGIDFSIKKLLSDTKLATEFEGGSLGVFRLAPQDYHRFHSPVDGTITQVKHIEGQYYTVNPMAIRTSIDVFGENSRTVISMESKEFGKVIIVCVGAMLVGSIILTAKVGCFLKRTDELGYFAFGGSTLIVIFEKGKITFDSDLLFNSNRTVETLVSST
ncbi:phosphatidylserine decarboxylase-domain-containing protein [Mycotypha africana]|uniref:phosphatidylserine decarboxylase-domain-containing protein n=1 Tax=Mycotypha africana TaxID=64632 RepID=UPI0023008794|nr:phosphatidylserine decarboxylase-domain-containing protein [Mycotypha africana]KAI8982378.1 phosphatidylserine decarboxylase-domain-containing protein [Mycotypha africana]